MKREKLPAAYFNGQFERTRNRPKIPPYPAMSPNWAWWLAGWNDQDRSQGVQQ